MIKVIRSIVLLAVVAGMLLLTPAQTQAACTGGACVGAGPRLASVNSTRGALLNALMGNLLGSSLNLSVLDWNAIATNDVNLGLVITSLQSQLGVSTPSQVLTTSATGNQILTALIAAANSTGNTTLVSALNNLRSSINGLSGTIMLGDFLNVSVPSGALTGVNINTLDFLTGVIQLYNYRNVVGTPTPVTISGAALGLGVTLTSVQLSAQVVEPPVFRCGGAGTTFHTATIRVKLALDLVDLNPAAGALNIPLTTSGAAVTLGQIDLYLEVARADGTITAINAVSHAVTMQVTPGVADAYLGAIADSLFWNRARALNATTDLSYGTIGSLTINSTTVAIRAKAYARGQAPFTSTLTFNGPFPQTQTASTSAVFAANLLDSLFTNLTLQLSPSLGVLDAVLLPLLKPIVTTALTSPLTTVLGSLVDPLLELLGVGLGEADVTVFGYGEYCTPTLGLAKSVLPAGAQIPGTDLNYSIAITNTGGSSASNIVVIDTIPANTDFKVGSVVNTLGTSGVLIAISYSKDNRATWTYVPVSAAGGAPANYDRLVTDIRWTVTGNLSQTSPNNTATISFISRIR